MSLNQIASFGIGVILLLIGLMIVLTCGPRPSCHKELDEEPVVSHDTVFYHRTRVVCEDPR